MLASQKIARARAGLILDQPFFGALALRQVLRENPSIKTARTDGQTLEYNPTFIDSLPLEQVKGVLAHEVMHVAAAHHSRRQDRQKRRWNIAADYAINDLLVQSGFALPAGALRGMGTDKSAETIYNTLPDDPPGGQGQGDQDPGGCGEVCDAPGTDGQAASPGELRQAEAESKVATSQAAQAAKNMGTLPAGLARFVEEVLEARVPWREVLRRFVDQTARNDYTWTRPNARYMAQGLYLPSLYSQEMAPIVIAVDTSGSIRQEELSQFSAEITTIIQDTRSHATVIYCDTDVAGVEEFDPEGLPIVLHAAGGGGTDFRPPFAHVDTEGLTPGCLIYLTDGECSRFPDAPEYPVLWALTGSSRHFSPPFGEIIEIK